MMPNSKGKIQKIAHAGCPDGFYLQCIDWYQDRKIEMYRRPPAKEWGAGLQLSGHHFYCKSRTISELRKAAYAAINDDVSKTEEHNGQRKLF